MKTQEHIGEVSVRGFAGNWAWEGIIQAEETS